MARKRRPKNAPKEITLTDLEAGRDQPRRPDTHAAGTPAGGTAAGGLAGTNVDDGSPDNADLEGALGSGIRDIEVSGDGPGYAGPSGGAVGGTPAGSRARGGRLRRGLKPGTHRGDSTIGADPDSDA